MLLSKQQVLDSLDTTTESYEAYLISLNVLPNDTLFTLDIEESVFAEYYDEEKDEFYRFQLDYDYSDKRMSMRNPYEDLQVDVNKLYVDYRKELEKSKKSLMGRVFSWNNLLIAMIVSSLLLSAAIIYVFSNIK